MNGLQKYFEELTAKYGDKVDMVSCKYDEETLALVPSYTREGHGSDQTFCYEGELHPHAYQV